MMARDEVIRLYFDPIGHRVLALFSAIAAARVEFAARRRVDRTRNVALEDRQFLILIGIRGRDRRDQCLRIRVNRAAEDVLRMRQLHHIAQIHNADARRS